MVCFFEFLIPSTLGGCNFPNSNPFLSVSDVPIGGFKFYLAAETMELSLWIRLALSTKCSLTNHSTLVIIYFVSNLTPKIKYGTANGCETINSKELGPVIMIGQSETWTGSQVILVTLFLQV
jgi:hypothetical protein